MSHHSVVRSEPRIGAFFDMDKTLIAENSGSLYMRHRLQLGEIGRLELLRGVGSYLQYKAGLLDIQTWVRNMSLEFRGQSESELEAAAVRWVEAMVADQIYPEARELVSDHLARGHVVAIVSGATNYVVRPIARCLGIEHSLYTQLEVVDGLFTGKVVEPVCFEEGKIYWLEKFIEEQGISLAKSWFYTDSVTDLPLLDLVGHPVVTNPDHMLYRMARKRRWPVRFFTPPETPR
jgi:putative phosphoserine phosphatase/1-acylglycerol-3-phosphate O-acyltransferase